MLGTNENPASLYPSLTPETVESTLAENPAVIQTPPASRERQRSIGEDEEIQSKILLFVVYSFLRVSHLLQYHFLRGDARTASTRRGRISS